MRVRHLRGSGLSGHVVAGHGGEVPVPALHNGNEHPAHNLARPHGDGLAYECRLRLFVAPVRTNDFFNDKRLQEPSTVRNGSEGRYELDRRNANPLTERCRCAIDLRLLRQGGYVPPSFGREFNARLLAESECVNALSKSIDPDLSLNEDRSGVQRFLKHLPHRLDPVRQLVRILNVVIVDRLYALIFIRRFRSHASVFNTNGHGNRFEYGSGFVLGKGCRIVEHADVLNVAEMRRVEIRYGAHGHDSPGIRIHDDNGSAIRVEAFHSPLKSFARLKLDGSVNG